MSAIPPSVLPNWRNALKKIVQDSGILYCTDAEGNWHYFQNWVKLVNPYAALEENGADVRLKLKDDIRFVYGGDIPDKGDGSIRLTRVLLRAKKEYPDRVVIILGNRDYNKMRFTSELNDAYLQQVDTTPGPYWVKESARVAPRQFLASLVGKAKDKKVEEVTKEEIHEVNTVSNRLEWMLKDTMGAAGDFDRRRAEIALLTQREPAQVKDEEVSASYIAWVDPSAGKGSVGEGGEFREILQLGQLAWRDEHTRTLFVHGGLQNHAFRYVPGVDHPVDDVDEWIDGLNNFAKSEVEGWLAQPRYLPGREDQNFVPGGRNGDWSARGGNRLLAYVCPESEPTVVLNNMFEPKSKNSQVLPAELVNSLLEANIIRVATGHTPHGNSATINRATPVELVNADTSYSDMKAPDNRGQAVTAVAFSEKYCYVVGVLQDGVKIEYFVGEKGDGYVGKPVTYNGNDKWWVKCRMIPQENKPFESHEKQYVLQQVDGIKVHYELVSLDELIASGLPHEPEAVSPPVVEMDGDGPLAFLKACCGMRKD